MGRLLVVLVLALSWTTVQAAAQEYNALVRIVPQSSYLVDRGGGVELQLGLSQGVPYRIYHLDEPRRIVIDFNEVDFNGLSAQDFDNSSHVTGYRVGTIAAGWSRMVLDIDSPMSIATAALETTGDGGAQVLIRLLPTDALEYSRGAGNPFAAYPVPNHSRPGADLHPIGDRDLIVVLDPGHGGIDPGAERDGVVEAELMLKFARELRELLLRSGGFQVVLTRQEDEFVPLETRVTIARRADADVFLSLHADALVEGRASGSTIYTLSEDASDIASQKLAERHDRADLLAGVDLSNQSDEIARVLMELARTDTAPRSDKLADALVTGLSATIDLHKRPRLTAGFSVLKAPDIPSVLLELGFISSGRDRERLTDADWRARVAIGIRDALQIWVLEDAADALLLRK